MSSKPLGCAGSAALKRVRKRRPKGRAMRMGGFGRLTIERGLGDSSFLEKTAFPESKQSWGGFRAIQIWRAVGRWPSVCPRLRKRGAGLLDQERKEIKNMKTLFSQLALVMVGVAGMGGVGCTSVHSQHPTAIENAVMCDKCKTTWVTRSEPTGRSVYRYTREKAMVCPDCRTAVENWLRTGELKHTCSHCKGKMTCESPKQN